MNKDETIKKLSILTFETEMLFEALHNTLKLHDDIDKTAPACYLSEIIETKFQEIRNLF